MNEGSPAPQKNGSGCRFAFIFTMFAVFLIAIAAVQPAGSPVGAFAVLAGGLCGLSAAIAGLEFAIKRFQFRGGCAVALFAAGLLIVLLLGALLLLILFAPQNMRF